MMAEPISSLTSERAQRALVMFYDLVPISMWKDGKRPPVGDVEALMSDLQKGAPADMQPLLAELSAQNGEAIKGEMAKFLLQRFSEYEPLRPYVEEAVAHSAGPRMALIPLIITALMVAMLCLEVKHREDGHLQIDWNPRNVVELAGHLADLAKTGKLGEAAAALVRG